jgi:hypothetical protein
MPTETIELAERRSATVLADGERRYSRTYWLRNPGFLWQDSFGWVIATLCASGEFSIPPVYAPFCDQLFGDIGALVTSYEVRRDSEPDCWEVVVYYSSRVHAAAPRGWPEPTVRRSMEEVTVMPIEEKELTPAELEREFADVLAELGRERRARFDGEGKMR